MPGARSRRPSPLDELEPALVLVVEDEPAIRELVRRTLEGAGLVVIEAENGRQALDIFALGGDPPRLVLTDVIMPELNGRELSDALADLHPRPAGPLHVRLHRRRRARAQPAAGDRAVHPEAVRARRAAPAGPGHAGGHARFGGTLALPTSPHHHRKALCRCSPPCGFPIVLSAVFVFILSAIIHMVLKYHNSDYKRLPNEDAVRAAPGAATPSRRQYIIPYCGRHEGHGVAGDEAEVHRGTGRGAAPPAARPADDGAIAAAVVPVHPRGLAVPRLSSRPSRFQPGADYLRVFRVVGAVGFLAYAAGQIPAAIWMGKPWSVAGKEVFDGLLYGLVTAGTFGWLWPR